MNVIVDTCVWSYALRRQSATEMAVVEELQSLIKAFRVQMLGVIRQKILSGIRSDAQFTQLKTLLRSFPDRPVLTEDHERAAEYFNLCRSKGIQGSNADFLICAVAVRAQHLIYTTDRDFEYYARYLPIRLYQP